MLLRVIKNMNNLYLEIVKSYTTLGDSVINEKELPKQIMRITRHVDVHNDLITIHILRYGLAKNLITILYNA